MLRVSARDASDPKVWLESRSRSCDESLATIQQLSNFLCARLWLVWSGLIMLTVTESITAGRALRVPVAASSERCSASRSASAHRELPKFAHLPRLRSAAGHRPALRSGARASARFTVQSPVASKTNSNVTYIRTLKRHKCRAPLTPEASNMNSRGCQPMVAYASASRPRRGRTIPHATIGSTLPGSEKISGSRSVGLHPRLFTLNPFGIHFGLRRQSAAATALSHARRSHEFAKTVARSKSGVALRLPPHSKTRPVHHDLTL